jgi:alkanesulfonate monooxygenase SsuD/methylene tetrahydromethanopterin reductase-like flavin-dependent oxidoreductase (luciferase family)
MKTGLMLPTWSGAMGGATPTTQDIIAFAELAEQVGFESLWVSDHFLNEPYVDYAVAIGTVLPEAYRGVKAGAWECWSLMAALAVRTTRVTLGTLVSNTGFRNPALLARMIDTVDDLSGGRVVAGLGAGDFPTEHQSFGYPFERRVSRFEEALAIIKPLLRGASSSMDGEFYRTETATLLPKGPRPGGPPIMIGALRGGPRMLRLITEYADQWNCMLPFGDSHPPAYLAAWQAMLVACDKHGRDPATLARHVTVGVCVVEGAYPLPGARPLEGSTVQLSEQIDAYAALGVETLSMVVEPCTPASLEALAPILDRHKD